MQHDIVLKKLNFDTPIVREGYVGKIFATMLLKHDHVLKKLEFYLLTPSQVSGWGSAVKIFSTMFLH